MTVEEIIYDILEIKGALEDDSDIEEMWLFHKINSWRTVFIQQEFALSNIINPVWLQRVTKFKFEKCTPSDDPVITLSSIILSKANLPKVISLPDDLGTYRVSGSGAVLQFEQCDFNTLMMKIEIGDDMNGSYGYYSKIGGIIYAWPLIMEGSAIIIAENPFDVQILEDGVLRNMTFADDYPIDLALAQKIVLEILTKDLTIAEGSIPDIVNDSQRQLKIMKDINGKN